MKTSKIVSVPKVTVTCDICGSPDTKYDYIDECPGCGRDIHRNCAQCLLPTGDLVCSNCISVIRPLMDAYYDVVCEQKAAQRRMNELRVLVQPGITVAIREALAELRAQGGKPAGSC